MIFSFPTSIDPGLDVNRFICYQFTASKARAHRHSVVLPRGMSPLPLAPPSRPVAWRALHALTDEAGALRVGVRAMLIDREISGGAVLSFAMRAIGAEILHERRIELPGGGPALDALTRSEEGGKTFISRWRSLKTGVDNGAAVLLLEARVPAELYSERAEDLFMASESFELREPGPFPFAERMYKHNRGTPGDFAFFRPESWEISDELIEDGTRIVRLFTQIQETPAGAITFICSTALTTRDQITRPYLQAFEGHNVELRMDPAREAPPFGGLDQTFEQRGVASVRAPVPGDLRIRVFGGARGRAWYLIGAVSPTAESFPMAAEIVARAQDLVMSTLRTLPV